MGSMILAMELNGEESEILLSIDLISKIIIFQLNMKSEEQLLSLILNILIKFVY